jgi:hypothetical protein
MGRRAVRFVWGAYSTSTPDDSEPRESPDDQDILLIKGDADITPEIVVRFRD